MVEHCVAHRVERELYGSHVVERDGDVIGVVGWRAMSARRENVRHYLFYSVAHSL